MKKIIFLLTLVIVGTFGAFAAELPSSGYSGPSFSDGSGFLDEPTLGMGDRIDLSSNPLGADGDPIEVCMDKCTDNLLLAWDGCGGDPVCEDALLATFDACMEECEAYSLPVGSGFFFLIFLGGAYGGIKLRRKRKEA